MLEQDTIQHLPKEPLSIAKDFPNTLLVLYHSALQNFSLPKFAYFAIDVTNLTLSFSLKKYPDFDFIES